MLAIAIDTWAEFKALAATKRLLMQYYSKTYSVTDSRYEVFLIEPGIVWQYSIVTPSTEATDFETNYQPTANQAIPQVNSPFAAKVIGNQKLYQRVHGFSVAFNGTDATETGTFTVPYPTCKITGVEVVNPLEGDACDFKVHDTPTGTISTIPDYMLNQFGFSVHFPQGLYRHTSTYDADLIQNMQIKVTYTQAAAAARTVYFNVILHELKT